jgi:uncharacterized repeat protein (TIGR03803 family)
VRKALFSFLLRSSLTVGALAVTLACPASAKPKFKILHGVPGGVLGGVTLDANGNLYGTTSGGGKQNKGTVFELSPGPHGWTLKTIHDFDGYDGGGFNDGLILDAAGNLFGTSSSGGQYNGGDVFEMTPGADGWTFKDLYDFCHEYHCPDGGSPAGLVIGTLGSLYGVAGAGPYSEGVVFDLGPATPSKWRERVLYAFQGTNTGFGPSGPLIFDPVGNLYGTTAGTFEQYAGTVFELKKGSSGWKRKTLWQFNEKNGAGPDSGVIFDLAGNLYGTTRGGGRTCDGIPCGTIFQLTQGSGSKWKHRLLYGFQRPEDGFLPSSGLVIDRTGNLYGTTATGGIGDCFDGCGVVYMLAPNGDGKWTYTVLHKFDGSDGEGPGGGLVLDGKGNLYGTAYSVVFEITP